MLFGDAIILRFCRNVSNPQRLLAYLHEVGCAPYGVTEGVPDSRRSSLVP